MRHFLILMGLFAGVAAMTPYFWTVLGMNFGAARVGAERPDGTIEWSIMGPDAPWPDWIPAIDGTKLTVASYAEPSDGYPGAGLAYVRTRDPAGTVQRAYARRLEALGWEVEVFHQQTTNAGLPSREISICTVIASKDNHSFTLALFEGEASQSRIIWRGEAHSFPKPLGATTGPC